MWFYARKKFCFYSKKMEKIIGNVYLLFHVHCAHFMLISFKVCKQACNLQDFSNTNVNKFIETLAIQRVVLIFSSSVVHQEDFQHDLTRYFLLYIFSFVQLAGCLPRRRKNRPTQANWKGESQYRWHQGLISKTKQQINLRRRENLIEHYVLYLYKNGRWNVVMIIA